VIVVYKYELLFNPFDGIATFKAPRYGGILKLAKQGKNICVWVEHDLDEPKIEYHFRVVMTGEELPENFDMEWIYIDTVFSEFLVLHIFHALGGTR
jgi:hypothetical protein